MDGGAQFKYLFLGSSYGGFTIDFYSSGTLTGKNVWVDESRSTAVQQITADANGMAIWYADGEYRMRISNSDGILLWDWPDVKITADSATMWEGNFGLSYPTASAVNRWQLFAKVSATNDFLELGINDGDGFVRINPEISASTFDSLNDVISQMGSTQCGIVVTKELTMTGATVVPSTMAIRVVKGGSINHGAYTLTLNGSFEAGLYQVFTGTGTVTFGAGSVKEVKLAWFGTAGDNVTSDSTAFNSAILSLPAGGGNILISLPTSKYYLATALTIDTKVNINFIGMMSQDPDETNSIRSDAANVFDIQESQNITFTNLNFEGDGTNTLFRVHGGGTVNRGFRFKNIRHYNFNKAYQIGETSTEGITTYAFDWRVDDSTFYDVVHSFILDAQAFDSFRMQNLNSYTGTSKQLIFVETTSAVSGSLNMDNVYFAPGANATHFVKLYAYALEMDTCWLETGTATGTLFLETAGAGVSRPTILRNCQSNFVNTDTGKSIEYAHDQALIVDGGYYAGDINVYQTVPATFNRVHFAAGKGPTGGGYSIILPGGNSTTEDASQFRNIYPTADNAFYLGKNDDDTPFAWKGVILKDTTNGKYYRIEVISGVVTATDLTD
jgi:hypothetical protein